ncbi:hypothetical protein [Psychroserpens sp.]|uniref:hypothetical protein n=1 Tax=Psychroserpens sp. TaxID=2020870 RepID=UPI001B017F60|nr:hypothetical protein [Psychroserpens sp.]MBO6606670.1 hypothetical protein [Psychroserpens sp.]MBO6653374.1 hypothetical protein [Psychroserpens sp.]MBO6680599.1 hypothetical protein [Psychroserpens sp.]MBO6750443.1 hypothetical protein [Psychroserpens sp.]MBO6914925.1 hypothetical protein [Psychroserpens sp.]
MRPLKDCNELFIKLKFILLCIIISSGVISCINKTNTSHSKSIKINEVSANKQKKAEINYASNPIAIEYKSIILEKYNNLDVNFALHYIVITWGCGSGCVSGAMVDSRDGYVYTLPHDKEWGGNGTYIKTNKNSNILTSVLAIQSPEGKIRETKKFWIWSAQYNKWKLRQ